MFELQIHVEILKLVQFHSAHLQVFRQFFDLLPLIPQIIHQSLDELFLLLTLVFLLGQFELQIFNNLLITRMILQQILQVPLLLFFIDLGDDFEEILDDLKSRIPDKNEDLGFLLALTRNFSEKLLQKVDEDVLLPEHDFGEGKGMFLTIDFLHGAGYFLLDLPVLLAVVVHLLDGGSAGGLEQTVNLKFLPLPLLAPILSVPDFADPVDDLRGLHDVEALLECVEVDLLLQRSGLGWACRFHGEWDCFSLFSIFK